MMLRSVRQYSNKANPGFLTDLLARIDAIPERVAQRKKENENSLKANVKPTSASPLASDKSNATVSRSNNVRINVADHPLALFNDSRTFSKNRRRFNNNNGNSPNPNNNRNGPSSNNGNRPQLKNKPKFAKRIVSSDKRVREQTAETSKKIVYSLSEPSLTATDLFHDRSSKLNHSLASRVASVTKELLIESKYPYKFSQDVIESAPKQGNKYILQNSYTTDIINKENLKTKVDSVVLGKVEEIDLKSKQIPKGLQEHAVFARKNLQLNGDLSTIDKQRVYDVVSGIKPVASILEGCHWIKK